MTCIWTADFRVENDDVAKPLKCISDDLAEKLADICIQVEGAFGSPQDIEWVAVEVFVLCILLTVIVLWFFIQSST